MLTFRVLNPVILSEYAMIMSCRDCRDDGALSKTMSEEYCAPVYEKEDGARIKLKRSIKRDNNGTPKIHSLTAWFHLLSNVVPPNIRRKRKREKRSENGKRCIFQPITERNRSIKQCPLIFRSSKK